MLDATAGAALPVLVELVAAAVALDVAAAGGFGFCSELKLRVPPAPIVRLVPASIADELASISVPAVTVVPPAKLSAPARTTVPSSLTLSAPGPLIAPETVN